MNFFKHTFQGFELDFKLLFIVIFLGIISWKGASRFKTEGEGLFSDGGDFIFKWGVHPVGVISFDAPLPPTMGNPAPHTNLASPLAEKGKETMWTFRS